MTNKNFASAMIAWQQQYGRQDLPWQQHPTPYRVWVSEIMLQQTQVKTVIPYYNKFIQRFDCVATLANATQDDVLHYWSGLGYYARARNLHRTAQIVQQQYHGIFPTTVDELCQLPGIGRSTAGAILSLALQQAVPILDGNVKRIFCRTHTVDGWSGDARILKKLWELAEQYTPMKKTAVYNQALMDLGATICTRTQPSCDKCPVTAHCGAYQQQQQHCYPQAKPSKKIPHKQTLMLIMLNEDNQILLEKRPPTGIWGGLWSLPQCDVDKDLQQWVLQHFNLTISQSQDLTKVLHKFSHFTLEIQPVLLKVLPHTHLFIHENSRQWYSKPQSQQLGLAKPVQDLLDKLL